MTDRARCSVKDILRAAVTPRIKRWCDYLDALNADGRGGGMGQRVTANYGVPSTGGATLSSLDLPAAFIEEAQQSARDIMALPEKERLAVRLEWRTAGTIFTKAEDCECSTVTYYQLLNRAYERLFFRWFPGRGTEIERRVHAGVAADGVG